ncbi:hypothetical protein D3C87_85200 [compost metagenome]
MNQANEINQLLQRLQFETPNCGGAYYFWKIDLAYSGDLAESVKRYLLRLEEPEHAPDLVLEKVADFKRHLREKLHYWSNHRTSLDCREEVTELYPSLEAEFQEKIHAFLEQENTLGVYVINSEILYSFGEDHVNDDTLIQTSDAFYVLHFGWSS